MLRFEEELRGACKEHSATVVEDFLLPELHAAAVASEFEAGIMKLPGAGSFRMVDADIRALVESVIACNMTLRTIDFANHRIGDVGVGQIGRPNFRSP